MALHYNGEEVLSLGCLPEQELAASEPPLLSWKENGITESIRHALTEGANLKEIKHTAADIALRIAMESCDGKVAQAAQALGVSGRLVHGWKQKQGKNQ